ncbi:hypothetical protein [Bradyrhizobium jicamae]|uniref:hypothetical protein n=1 Tax=Bradyrhizobium jicamae TaxID=280332 RepID=UPI0020112B02|nr:hypothetical protein [Bradyrhizobium jicamae]
MRDKQAHLEELSVEAEECELVGKLATEKDNKALFAKLASRHWTLADEVERPRKGSQPNDLEPLAYTELTFPIPRAEPSRKKECMGQIRRRVIQTNSLKTRLIERARELRDQAATLTPGIEKEALLKLARQSEAGASMTEWLRSEST